MVIKNLQEENSDLRKSLHELRKIESGWFGKEKKFVKKEVIVQNVHYNQQLDELKALYTSLQLKHNELLAQNQKLVEKNEELSSQVSTLNSMQKV